VKEFDRMSDMARESRPVRDGEAAAPHNEVRDDEFRCAECHKIFSLDDEHHRADLAQICPACYDANDDWQCDDCCYLKAEWEPQFEQADGSVICEGCAATRDYRENGPRVIHIQIHLPDEVIDQILGEREPER
jgi:hypothetical protein